MTILLATLLATSAVAYLIHFLVLRNERLFLNRAYESYIDQLKEALHTQAKSEAERKEACFEELVSKVLEIDRLKDALHTRAENELKRISESSKEIDTLKALTNDLKLKTICASDLYNVELEKHKATIETLQNNFASYKAEKEAKIDKLKLDHFQSRKNIYAEKNVKIRALESECLECQRSLERLTSQGNQKTALIEDLRTQINRQAERFNLHASDVLKGIDLDAKSRAIDLLQTEYQALLDVNAKQSTRIRALEETHREDLKVISRLLKENLTQNNSDGGLIQTRLNNVRKEEPVISPRYDYGMPEIFSQKEGKGIEDIVDLKLTPTEDEEAVKAQIERVGHIRKPFDGMSS